MKEHCDNGGRFLHWIGYRSENIPERGKGSDFLYLGKYDPLMVEAWRPNNPNSKNPNQCLTSYLGLEPNASWYVYILKFL